MYQLQREDSHQNHFDLNESLSCHPIFNSTKRKPLLRNAYTSKCTRRMNPAVIVDTRSLTLRDASAHARSRSRTLGDPHQGNSAIILERITFFSSHISRIGHFIKGAHHPCHPPMHAIPSPLSATHQAVRTRRGRPYDPVRQRIRTHVDSRVTTYTKSHQLEYVHIPSHISQILEPTYLLVPPNKRVPIDAHLSRWREVGASSHVRSRCVTQVN